MRAIPEEKGVSSERIASFLKELDDDPTLNTHSVLIWRGGAVLAEASFGAQRTDLPKYTFSACKSVTSLLIGILIGEGKLSLNDKVISFFDERSNPILALKWKDLTVKALLTMTSGASFMEADAMTEKDWIHGFFTSTVHGDIGKTFNYNSLNTYMLAAIVARVTGKTVSAFAEERLFSPLGIRNYYWEACPMGIEKGGWGLYIRPEDFLKLGVLVLQNGEWEGEQIVPADYIADAVTAHQTAPAEDGCFNYGYQIWVGRKENAFLFNGMLGQNVLCFRDSGVILVSNAGNSELFQTSSYFEKAKRYFAELPDAVLPPDPSVEKLLENTLRILKHEPKEPKRSVFARLFRKKRKPDPFVLTLCGTSFGTDSDLSSRISVVPALMQVIGNHYPKGLDGISFALHDGCPYLSFTEGGDENRIPVFPGRREELLYRFEGENWQIAAETRLGTDEDGNKVLSVRIDFLETPFTRLIKLRFQPGDRISLEMSELPGKELLTGNLHLVTDAIANVPLIGKMEPDYFLFKIGQLMTPVLPLEKKEEVTPNE
ncbi:MAG: beta-lactamase family protein [Lachnospiraceae bacterium]|nr:beta-lactamase family protein [Lachnospiraceae bacterium]